MGKSLGTTAAPSHVRDFTVEKDLMRAATWACIQPKLPPHSGTEKFTPERGLQMGRLQPNDPGSYCNVFFFNLTFLIVVKYM